MGILDNKVDQANISALFSNNQNFMKFINNFI